MTGAVCVYCDKYAPNAVVVGYVPGASGPGFAQLAHAECAREHGRAPAADVESGVRRVTDRLAEQDRDGDL